MPYPKSEQELAKLFRSLGAHEPEAWVHGLLEDPEPQLARYLFLKLAWDRVIGDGDTKWIERSTKRANEYPDEPYAGLGLALQRVLAAGILPEDIAEICRCVQAKTLFDISYLIDGPTDSAAELEEIDWALFRVDENGVPFGERIGGLHESVLETDPTGREMRPKR